MTTKNYPYGKVTKMRTKKDQIISNFHNFNHNINNTIHQLKLALRYVGDEESIRKIKDEIEDEIIKLKILRDKIEEYYSKIIVNLKEQ